MYNISDNQVDFILEDIKKRGLELEDLQNNLLDHICCIIENEMDPEQDFNEFYKKTISKFYKNKLIEIEEETKDLLTFKNFYIMKRTMKIIGLLSSVFLLFGVFFKLMHWPGASLLVVFGAGLFSLIFLPLMMILKFRDEGEKKDKIVFILGLIIGIIAILGMLFKIMHWPYSSILIKLSIGSFIFVFVPVFFINGYRQAEKRFNTIISSFLMVVGASLLFAITNLNMSYAVQTSLYSVNNHLNNSTKNIVELNQNMYNHFTKMNDVNKLHENTQQLYSELEKLKIYLISETENIDETTAALLSLEKLSHLGDGSKVTDFLMGKGDYTYTKYKSSLQNYNKTLKDLVALPIQIDEKKPFATTLAIFVHQLTQIQQQIVINENAYLNYIKGKINK